VKLLSKSNESNKSASLSGFAVPSLRINLVLNNFEYISSIVSFLRLPPSRRRQPLTQKLPILRVPTLPAWLI
jgi:hypothetical protein